jgi:hypothetical protein
MYMLVSGSFSLCSQAADGACVALLQPQEKVYKFSSGLVRFLSDGVASAAPTDPLEIAEVKRLLCADTVARCIAAMDKFVKRGTELNAIIAGWNVYQAVRPTLERFVATCVATGTAARSMTQLQPRCMQTSKLHAVCARQPNQTACMLCMTASAVRRAYQLQNHKLQTMVQL